jgi:hypothetical protein
LPSCFMKTKQKLQISKRHLVGVLILFCFSTKI